MSIYKDFKTDKKLEKEGVWFEYGDYKFLLARAGGANKAYEVCLENKAKPYRRAILNDIMPARRQDDLVKEVYIETVILGWEGVTDEHEDPIPFSKENLRKLLEDLPDVWVEIREIARQSAAYKAEVKNIEAKNS